MLTSWQMTIMLLNLYNSKKNTDSLRESQSEWRPKIVAGFDVDGLKICSTCLFNVLRFALRLNFSFVLLGFLEELKVFTGILYTNRLTPLAIQ